MMRRLLGPILTLGMIVLTEAAAGILGHGSLVVVAIFLLSLVPVAYAALTGGLAMGALSTALLMLYTLHFTAKPPAIIALDVDAWSAVGVIAALGLGMSWPMARIKAREDRLRAALEARARDLEARNAELSESNAALEAFGYVVSHDLKEPVRALENYLDAAREAWPDEDSRTFIQEAYRANQRLSRLLQGLLAYSRASSTTAPPRALSIPQVARAETCRAQWEPLFRERGAVLSIDEGIPPVLAAEVILEQVIANLLLNAVRHNPRLDPKVHVRSEPAPSRHVRVVFADNGPGFPREVIERFDTLRAGRPATIKSGFGLVIAHRAMHKLGGHMHLQNAEDGSAEVVLDLPAGEAPEVDPDLRLVHSSIPGPPART